MLARLLAVALGAAAVACATAPKPRAVDLQPARQALEEARAEGAAERAPQTFHRAEGELSEAERLVAQHGPDAPLAAVEAEWAARLALAEARCAAREAPATRDGGTDGGASGVWRHAHAAARRSSAGWKSRSPCASASWKSPRRSSSGPRPGSRAWRRGPKRRPPSPRPGSS